MDEDRDLDAELRALIAQMESDRVGATAPTRESLREVEREAAQRRRGTPEARRARRTRRTAALVVVVLAVAGGLFYARGAGLLPSFLNGPDGTTVAEPSSATSPTPTPSAGGDRTSVSASAVPVSTTGSTPAARSAPTPAVTAGQKWPTPGLGAAASPLGHPPRVAHPSSHYRFLVLQKGSQHTPVAWDPCRQIHWVVNTSGMPAQGLTMLRQAFRALTTATGLPFVYDGTTKERSTFDRGVFQPKRYGNRWAPVLIEWFSPQQQHDFVGDVIGKGGPQPMYIVGGPEVYVSGEVEFDAPWMKRTLAQGQRATAEAVVLHELGHLIGLDHVTDTTQLMFARETPGIVHYGSGDLTGLARLGAGKCEPRL